MKKFLKWYMKWSAILYVLYAIVGFLGGSIIKKHPLKNEDNQMFANFLFTMMQYCCFSPYYSLRMLFGKQEKKVAE